jgi:Fe-S cluster biogenesis protein NfuA
MPRPIDASVARVDSPEAAKLTDLLTQIAAPLLGKDAGELYLVRATAREVHVHLAGSYAGCPGVPYVERHLLAPLVADVFPKAELKVSSGLPMPKGAKRLEPAPA